MRGKRVHKGRTRKFTAPEEIDRQLGIIKDSSEENIDGALSSSTKQSLNDNVKDGQEMSDSTDSGDDDDDDNQGRHKGVAHLIKVSNPNHQSNSRPAMPSRKELEASTRMMTNPINLKSDEELARDIARLNLVRKEREEAARKLEEEKQIKQTQRNAALQRGEERLQASRLKGKQKSKNYQAKAKPKSVEATNEHCLVNPSTASTT